MTGYLGIIKFETLPRNSERVKNEGPICNLPNNSCKLFWCFLRSEGGEFGQKRCKIG